MYFLIGFAILFLILIPLAPALVRLRIRILKRLHWNWAVDLLERHFSKWVAFTRIVLFAIAAVLALIAWRV